mmetsp:Transcript_87800/g.152758  ORF Transcript_87800/g.152758 Transcript_87800/m.152758 type:complete len:235 (+) Transcript_87800:503-1207(+)
MHGCAQSLPTLLGSLAFAGLDGSLCFFQVFHACSMKRLALLLADQALHLPIRCLAERLVCRQEVLHCLKLPVSLLEGRRMHLLRPLLQLRPLLSDSLSIRGGAPAPESLLASKASADGFNQGVERSKDLLGRLQAHQPVAFLRNDWIQSLVHVPQCRHLLKDGVCLHPLTFKEGPRHVLEPPPRLQHCVTVPLLLRCVHLRLEVVAPPDNVHGELVVNHDLRLAVDRPALGLVL